MYIFINGKWTSQELQYREICGNFKISKYHEFHINTLDDTEHFPSEIVSKLLGLNIHTDWGIEGSCCEDSTDDDVIKEFHKITEAYPEFLSIKPCDRKVFMRDVRAGCISKFNYEDIKYYCEIPWEERIKREKSLYELYKKINFHFSWICSPSTLNKIERHVEENNTVISLEFIKEKLNENTK